MELIDESDFAPITCAEHASSVVLAMRSKNRTLLMGGPTEQVLRRPDDSEVIGPRQNQHVRIQYAWHLAYHRLLVSVSPHPYYCCSAMHELVFSIEGYLSRQSALKLLWMCRMPMDRVY